MGYAYIRGMSSKYDYPDPGTDPRYCDSISDPPDGPTCLWCGAPLPEGETDYCSSICSIHAEMDAEMETWRDSDF